MSSLYGILSVTDILRKIPVGKIIEKLPLIAVIVCGAILAIAFLVGFVKGFRRVAWGGFYWLFASAAFVGAYKYLATRNPLVSLFKGTRLANAAEFAWVIVLALVCASLALLLYGVLGAIFRPKEVWAKERETESDEYGFEYENDDEDDTLEGEEEILVIKGGGKPSFFGRLAGAFMSTVNAAAVLGSIAVVFLLLIDATAITQKYFGDFLENALVKKAHGYAVAYALDVFTVGIILSLAYIGYKAGFVRSAHAVTATLGIVLVVILCFAIPFTRLSSWLFFDNIIARCGSLFTKMRTPYRGIATKLTAGALMAVAAAVVMLIFNFLLGKLVNKIEDREVARVIDGILAVIVYLMIGVLVVGIFWSGLYVLDYCGIFATSNAFNDSSAFGKEFFEIAERYIKPLADKYLLRFKA